MTTQLATSIKDGQKGQCESRRAREIMGDDHFFDIKDARRHFRVSLSDEQIGALAKVPFPEEVLKSCRGTHILIAVPEVSLLDVREANSLLFVAPTGRSYENMEFARNRGTASWHLVQITPVANSTSRTWDEQRELLDKGEEVPSVRVVVCAAIGYYRNTGEILFEDTSARCSCVDSDGNRVLVGYYRDCEDLDIDECFDDERDSRISLFSARKPCTLNS